MSNLEKHHTLSELPKLTKAEENILTTQHLVKDMHYSFLELGGLLLENQEAAYWSQCAYGSFQEFVEMLGISYSFATRLMGIARIVASQLLSKEEVLEIGVSKSCLLLPLLARGELDDDTKELAKSCPYRDLKLHLGHKVKDEDSSEYLTCPRCGVEFSFQKDMLRRR